MELDGTDGAAERGRLSADVFGLMWVFVHRTSRDAAADLDRHGLNPAKLQLLLAVRRRPGAAQRELGALSGVTGGNVSMLLAKLEDAGLVRREARGAANQVWLTDAGTELVERLAPEHDRFMLDRFGTLDDSALAELRRLLAAAVEGLPPPV